MGWARVGVRIRVRVRVGVGVRARVRARATVRGRARARVRAGGANREAAVVKVARHCHRVEELAWHIVKVEYG